MSTITSTKSTAEALFDSFRPAERKYDLRTARGKFWKELVGTNPELVTNGIVDYVKTGWNRDYTEQVETITPYHALRITTGVEVDEAIATIVAYLREVQPTREVRDEEYNKHTIPNFVRVVLERIYLEENEDGWGAIDGDRTYKVLSVAIDPETDEAFHIIEFVDFGHSWYSNPFVEHNSWRHGNDNTSTLDTYQHIVSVLEKKRTDNVRSARIAELIAECIEQGLENASWKYESVIRSCEKFLAEHDARVASFSLDDKRPVEAVFSLAEDVALAKVVRYYLECLGKTTWEVNSNSFVFESRRHLFGEQDGEARPRFIDEVLAYAIVVDWYIRETWDIGTQASKGSVLKDFSDLIRY